MNVSALIFDGLGALFNLDTVIPEFGRVFGVNGAAASRWWRARQLAYTRRCVLTRRYVDLFQLMTRAMDDTCRHFQNDASAQTRAYLCQQYLSLDTFPDATYALRALRENFRLGILSHGTQTMLDALVERNHLAQFFEQVLSVDAVRAYKPERRAYALAAEKFQLAPNAMAYVGVNPFDVAGAKGFGMKTIWLHRITPDTPLMKLLADQSVTSLNALTQKLLETKT